MVKGGYKGTHQYSFKWSQKGNKYWQDSKQSLGCCGFVWGKKPAKNHHMFLQMLSYQRVNRKKKFLVLMQWRGYSFSVWACSATLNIDKLSHLMRGAFEWKRNVMVLKTEKNALAQDTKVLKTFETRVSSTGKHFLIRVPQYWNFAKQGYQVLENDPS